MRNGPCSAPHIQTAAPADGPGQGETGGHLDTVHGVCMVIKEIYTMAITSALIYVNMFICSNTHIHTE